MATRKRDGYKTFDVTFASGKVLRLVDTNAGIEDQASFYRNSYGKVVSTKTVKEGI